MQSVVLEPDSACHQRRDGVSHIDTRFFCRGASISRRSFGPLSRTARYSFTAGVRRIGRRAKYHLSCSGRNLVGPCKTRTSAT